MIRLPPSSISLSERDIDFHLRHAEMYDGLLRQGFKKEDVIRYLNDYREATLQAAYRDAQGFNLNVPSTFELSCSQPRSSVTSEDGQHKPIKQTSGHSSSTRSTNGSVTTFPDLSPDDLELEAAVQEDAYDDNAGSPGSMAPTMHVNQHAPRKSSLLRFAKIASPERRPVESDQAFMVPAASRTKKYKRRSNTYPYQSSDRDSVGDTLPHEDVVDGMSRLSLTQDHESDDMLESIPFALPPSFSPNSPTHSDVDLTFASPLMSPLDEEGSAEASSVNDVRQTSSRRPSSSLLGHSDAMLDIPSSPPLPRTPARYYSRQTRTTLQSPQLPVTPTPIRNASTMARTEPRHYRNQLDGNAFSVYNDSLPAGSQPRTPADLSRQLLITEHDAAYTAPPGMIRVETTSRHDRRVWDRDSGEQSPVARAFDLRERRNRELMRSVRAEGVRLNRLRVRDEAMFTQRSLQANGNVQVEALPQMPDDVWRDDLDVDRVGEENFEADPDASQRRVMRAVSGNARFDA